MGLGSAGNCLHPLALLRATTRCRQGLGAGDRAKPSDAPAAVEPHRDRPRGTVPSSRTSCTDTRERCRVNPSRSGAQRLAGAARATVPARAGWQQGGCLLWVGGCWGCSSSHCHRALLCFHRVSRLPLHEVLSHSFPGVLTSRRATEQTLLGQHQTKAVGSFQQQPRGI